MNHSDDRAASGRKLSMNHSDDRATPSGCYSVFEKILNYAVNMFGEDSLELSRR